MNCEEVRIHLHDFVRRRLEPHFHRDVGAHLQSCPACSGAERAEVALDELLEQRLPRYAAPGALKRRLGLLMGRPEAARAGRTRWTRFLAPALAAGLALTAGGVLLQQRSASRNGELDRLTSEVVNDHLRVLARQHAVDIESGGTHQVKPWFEGKLDFAPVVPAPGEGELRLLGGSVGYVFDRKAAVVVYQLRLHVVTLLVFRPEGLPWPGTGDRPIGPVRGAELAPVRGFNVVLWRAGGLAYALVADVNEAELRDVAARFAAATVEHGGR